MTKEQWKAHNHNDRYVANTKDRSNPNFGKGKSKYIDKKGNIIWPKNDGFAETPHTEILQPGTKIDRYGNKYGTFVSPEGIPYENRALSPGTENKPYNVYEVIEPLEVKAGKIEPWFHQSGGGTQYKLDTSVNELIELKIIK